MNIRDFVKDSLEKFAAKCKEMFGTPVLEVTGFDAGDETTEEGVFSHIKLNGKIITSFDQLKSLNGKPIIARISSNECHCVYNGSVDEVFVAVFGGIDPDNEFGGRITIYVDTNDYSNSFISIFEM